MQRNRTTYVDAPELLDGVEGDNFLEQIVPIVALFTVNARTIELDSRLYIDQPFRWRVW